MRYTNGYTEDCEDLANLIYKAIGKEPLVREQNKKAVSAAVGAVCASLGVLHDDLRRIAQALEDNNNK